jgi:Outer membrane protein beta-barrel domain
MSEFDFLKEFGKDMDREQPHNFGDADWKGIESRLDSQDIVQSRRRRFAIWSLPLASLAGFILLGVALWQSNQKTDLLQANLEQLQASITLKNTSTTSITTIDSIISVVKYDTIYRTVFVTREVNKNTIVSSNSGLENQIIIENSFLRKKENETGFKQITPQRKDKIGENANLVPTENLTNLILETKNTTLGTQGVLENQTTNWLENQTVVENTEDRNSLMTSKLASNNDLLNKNRSIEILPIRPIKAIEVKKNQPLPDLSLVLQIEPIHNYKEELIEKIKPEKKLEIGLRTGLLFPYNEHVKSQSGYNAGINAGFKLWKHLHLTAGADLGQVEFTVRANDISRTQIPTLLPPTPNDVLKSVQIKHPLVDFSLGLRYSFRDNKPLKPYFSAAWLTQNSFEQNLKYEFYNAVIDDERFIKKHINDRNSFSNGFQIGFGADWRLRKHWLLGIEGVYQKQFSRGISLLEQRLNVRTGVKYSF